MNLVIDIGNTRVKVALFENGSMCFVDSFGLKDILIRIKKILENNSVDRAIISSVANITDHDLAKLQKLFSLLCLNRHTEVPFKNAYATKETLGVDRIALAAAAVMKYPENNVLVIDAGSCITSDFVSSSGVFKGGAISPGILMRYKALNQFTDKLPQLNPISDVILTGDSTEAAIHSGVINGVISEINGIIDAYKSKYKKLTVVLTGGDTYFLANRLKNGIFANPNFLLEGLNYILIQSREND